MFAACKVAQGLQTRCQAQHDDAQIFAECQQHFAHVFSLRARVVLQLRSRSGRARQALYFHQLGRFYGKRCKLIAKSFGNDLVRAAKVRARIDQITGGLHIVTAVHGIQNGHHRIGMGEHVLAGV